MEFPQTWKTQEFPPRRLVAKGVSAFSNDCLVAYFDGEDKAVWLLYDGNKTENVMVIQNPAETKRVFADLEI